ncbi:class F sortase [Nakamurella endophytica]|uniref:class F sortase n=1 Tax=Nakamurella endophytica TaxID=1748367 RepID=UPI00166C414F|nr:class F sortase [Nakamurella endophytica]
MRDVAPPAPPERLRIPALGVSAPVDAVGVDGDGNVDIPRDVRRTGWYRFGPAPGSARGSAVITGHVDDHEQGVGVLARIGDLAPGDRIETVDASGAVRRFTVVAREEWHKTAVPMDRLFDRGGASRLVLMTCGGEFDRDTLSYEDNVAVTAVPAGT